MRRILKVTLVFLMLLLITGVVFVRIRIRDRHPGYKADLQLPFPGVKHGQLKVGFGLEKITPELPDSWTDVDNNARFEPEKGDRWVDGNNNGKFDAYWMAGFDNRRAANGIHDDLWARAIVWDDSASVVGLVVLDAIGFLSDDVITVRKLLAGRVPEIDHLIITSTHCHEVPDLMGMWGESPFKTGVNPEYRNMVMQKAVDAVYAAYHDRKPASLEFAQIDSVKKDLIDDGRMPFVYDDGIRLMRVLDRSNGALMGLLVNHGNHPETAGSKNLLITSDIAHYMRDGIERGIFYDDEMKRNGAGGTVIFMNGAVGGIMSGMWVATYDPWLQTTFAADDNSFDKVRAQGYRLADTILCQLEQGSWTPVKDPSIRLHARSIELLLQNRLFKLGAVAGVFDRGLIGLRAVRSEINLLAIGPAWFLTIPGEINPEIINGGIETPEGRDFEIAAQEVPPVRELMKGDINFVIGLANDEVGYIMPKTHWDEKAPFSYGEKEAPYGEINSLGPEAGPDLYRQVSTLIHEMESVSTP